MPLIQSLDSYNLTEFTDIAAAFGQERFGYVVTPNVDHLIRYHDDPDFRSAYADASYILLDSRFLSYLFRVFYGIPVKVCTGSDLTSNLFNRVVRPDDTIVLIGGSSSQSSYLADRFGLRNLRHFIPPMGFINDPHAVEECLRFIESQSPFRFCILGVGAPQQELVAQQLKSRGKARGLALCAGASINFITGAEQRAPYWVQLAGFEWAYRLGQDPHRLAHRYLVRGPRIFGLLGKMKIVVRHTLTA